MYQFEGTCLETQLIVDIVLRRFLHNHGYIATDGIPKPDYAVLLFPKT